MKKLTLYVVFVFVFVSVFVSSAFAAMEHITSPVSQLIFQASEETTIYTNNWSNDDFSLQFRLTWIGCKIRITNNTEEPMLLVWSKSAFVDVNGGSHRLMPGETRRIHAAQAIPETMIPPHTSYAPMAVAEGYDIQSNYDMKLILDFPLNQGLFGYFGLASIKSKAYKTFAQKYKERAIALVLCLNIRGTDKYFKIDMPLEFDKGLDALPEIDERGNVVENNKIAVGFKLKDSTVSEIQENSIAAKAGLNIGDVILEINGRSVAEISNPQDFIESRFNDGRTVMVLCERGTEKIMVTLKKAGY